MRTFFHALSPWNFGFKIKKFCRNKILKKIRIIEKNIRTFYYKTILHFYLFWSDLVIFGTSQLTNLGCKSAARLTGTSRVENTITLYTWKITTFYSVIVWFRFSFGLFYNSYSALDVAIWISRWTRACLGSFLYIFRN